MSSQLTEEQRDALQELMNISMGQAANALACLIATRIQLSIPKIISVTPEDFIKLFDDKANNWFTRQSFLGVVNGEVITLLSQDGCEALAEAMDYDTPLNSSSRKELVLELANILAGACLNGFAEQLALKTKLNMPTLYQPTVQDQSEFNWQSTLLMEVDFIVEQAHFSSRVVICLEPRSVNELMVRLSSLLE